MPYKEVELGIAPFNGRFTDGMSELYDVEYQWETEISLFHTYSYCVRLIDRFPRSRAISGTLALKRRKLIIVS